jgi:hypothetical protein
MEARVHVGAPTPLSGGGMDGSDRLGRPAVAGAYRYLGMAGYSASALDLFRAHGVSSTPLQKLHLDGALRARVAVLTGLAVLGYVLTVYLIFFLTYTPLNVDHVRGVQGRYFVIALPIAAIFLASVINIDLRRNVLATIAITGALLSGLASFQALLGAHWSVP